MASTITFSLSNNQMTDGNVTDIGNGEIVRLGDAALPRVFLATQANPTT